MQLINMRKKNEENDLAIFGSLTIPWGGFLVMPPEDGFTHLPTYKLPTYLPTFFTTYVILVYVIRCEINKLTKFITL
jgi:hypothetical protein